MFTVFEAKVGKSSELQNELSRPPTTHSDDLHKELNWTTLEAGRNMNRLCLVYKCVRSQVPTTLSSKFEANKGRTKGSYASLPEKSKYKFLQKFIHIQDWNNLTIKRNAG